MKIQCVHSALAPLAELQEHPKNPNRHDAMQISLLAEVIKLNGWRKPIVVSSLSGFIVKGHCRYAAAKLLKLETVPVEYQSYTSEAEELADMLADNRIAEFAKIDGEKLDVILASIRESDFPVLAAGFRDADFVGTAASEDEGDADEQASDSPVPLVQKGSIGVYQFNFSIEEQNKWLEGLYAAVGKEESAVIAEVKRRLGL